MGFTVSLWRLWRSRGARFLPSTWRSGSIMQRASRLLERVLQCVKVVHGCRSDAHDNLASHYIANHDSWMS